MSGGRRFSNPFVGTNPNSTLRANNLSSAYFNASQPPPSLTGASRFNNSFLATGPNSLIPGLGTQIYGNFVESTSARRSNSISGHGLRNDFAVPSSTNQHFNPPGQESVPTLRSVTGYYQDNRYVAHRNSTSSTSSSRPPSQTIRPPARYEPGETQAGHSGGQSVIRSFQNPQIQITSSSLPSGNGTDFAKNVTGERGLGSINPPIASTGDSSSDAPGPSSSQNDPRGTLSAFLEGLQNENTPVQPSRGPMAIALGHKYDVFNTALMNRVTAQCMDEQYRNTPTAIATYHQLAMADDLFFDRIWTGKFLVNDSYIFEYQYRARSRPDMPDQARRDRRVIFVWAENQRTRTSGWHRVVDGRIFPEPCCMKAPPAEYEDTLNLWRFFFQKVGGLVNVDRYAQLVVPHYIDNSQDAIDQNKRAVNMARGPTASRSAYRIAPDAVIFSDDARLTTDFIFSTDLDPSPITGNTLTGATTSFTGPSSLDPSTTTDEFGVDVAIKDPGNVVLSQFYDMDAGGYIRRALSAPTAPIGLYPDLDVSAAVTAAPDTSLVPAGNDIGLSTSVLHNENLDIPPAPETGASAPSALFDLSDIYGHDTTLGTHDNSFSSYFDEAFADISALVAADDPSLFWNNALPMSPRQPLDHPPLPLTADNNDPLLQGGHEEENEAKDGGVDVQAKSD